LVCWRYCKRPGELFFLFTTDLVVSAGPKKSRNQSIPFAKFWSIFFISKVYILWSDEEMDRQLLPLCTPRWARVSSLSLSYVF
jgi:hypothetical protein